MRARYGLSFLCIALLLASGCAQSADERAIQKAISQVFPALVFVKPIVQDLAGGEKENYQIFGSGSIISQDGYIVTNNHVAEKSKEITCVLFNKEEVKAKVIGLDPEADLAVLKLDPDDLARMMKEKGLKVLPMAKFGDSDKLKQGQAVLALGSPFGFTRSVTRGIVCSTERFFEDFPHHLWIQTDASINPGNSGGPLVNLRGEIVGVNTLGMFGSGLGFSIPSNVVKDIVARIIKDGRVIRAYFGLSFQAIHDFTRSMHIKAEKGGLIANVELNSPAQAAGIVAGDVLISVNGVEVNTLYEPDIPTVVRRLAFMPVGVEATLVIQHKEELKTIVITPIEKAKYDGDEFECKVWNMVVKEITKESSPYTFFLKPKGVYVFGVKSNGNADASGFGRGDIIERIDNKPITNLADLKAIYEELATRPKGKRKVPVMVNRNGLLILLVLEYETNVKKIEEEERE
ncbi:MAG: trypsin-like peptidase domain-containing protein [Candidatus Brocadiia bacterium]